MNLDFSAVEADVSRSISLAIERENSIAHAVGSEAALPFIMANHAALAQTGVLEQSWLDAYVFASSLSDWTTDQLQAVFDSCHRPRLQELAPITCAPSVEKTRVSIFRGCAGPEHTLGMSWTTSLDQAIWYAAWHGAYRNLDNLAVYAATVDISEIYCQLDRHEVEVIVRPNQAWRIDVPPAEFSLDRPR